MRNVLLIHGAWQGSWVWSDTATALEAAGFQPHALDLPGNGAHPIPFENATFEDCIEAAVSVIDDCAGTAAVVAHSGGGLLASQIAEARPDRIDRMIYVAGMMLPGGQTFSDLVDEAQADDPNVAGIWPFLERTACGRGTCVPVEAACRIFYHDCPPDDALAAAARLTPQPDATRAVSPGPLTTQRFERVARAYVECRRDRSILLTLQRRMQALVPGALTFSLDTGHAPMLVQPVAFTSLMTTILNLPLGQFQTKGASYA
ncbi:MAG: alpha/beta fold hydrolase [Pseudomonadota bacterium]